MDLKYFKSKNFYHIFIVLGVLGTHILLKKTEWIKYTTIISDRILKVISLCEKLINPILMGKILVLWKGFIIAISNC